jgi:hypothetical protein
MTTVTKPPPKGKSQPGKQTYSPRAIRTARRTPEQIEALKNAIYGIVKGDKPMTVRQIFYRCVARGLIQKSEAEYKQTIIRLVLKMRESGRVPWAWIADSTRWVRQARMFDSLTDLLDDAQKMYRRNLWADQRSYVELWLEKDALGGVLYPITSKWGVPLMVSRGFASATFLQSAAEAISKQGKPAHIYSLTDHDPSGLAIESAIERRLRQFAPEAEIHFERAAVTPEQISAYRLPTRPTKRTDSRAKGFKGDSVDLDALEPRELRRIARACIERHIDADALARTRTVERAERATLAELKDGVDFAEAHQ